MHRLPYTEKTQLQKSWRAFDTHQVGVSVPRSTRISGRADLLLWFELDGTWLRCQRLGQHPRHPLGYSGDRARCEVCHSGILQHIGSCIHDDSDFVRLFGITDWMVRKELLFRGWGRCLFRGKLSRITLVSIVFNNVSVFLRQLLVTLQFPFGTFQSVFQPLGGCHGIWLLLCIPSQLHICRTHASQFSLESQETSCHR